MNRKLDIVVFEEIVELGLLMDLRHICALLFTQSASRFDRGVALVDLQDLLLENQDFFEGLVRCYRLDQKKAAAGPHAQILHCRVLLLANCVYVHQGDLIIDHALFAVGVYKEREVSDERYVSGL